MRYIVKRLCSKVTKEYRDLCHFLRAGSKICNMANAHFLRAHFTGLSVDS